MKLVVLLACLVVLAVATPLQEPFIPTSKPPIPILDDSRQDHGDGNFRYNFETGNGISVDAFGSPGFAGQTNIHGFYRFTFPNGEVGEVHYVANENGYRITSPRAYSDLTRA